MVKLWDEYTPAIAPNVERDGEFMRELIAELRQDESGPPDYTYGGRNHVTVWDEDR